MITTKRHIVLNAYHCNNSPCSYYGDWCSAYDGFSTGCSFTGPDISSFYYIAGLKVLTDFARILNNNGDMTKYGAIAQAAITQYNTQFYNATTASYAAGYPINQMLPLVMDIAADTDRAAVYNTLKEWIANSYAPTHNAGGIVSSKYLYPTLSAFGDTDLGVQIQLQTDFPSIGYWIDNNTEAFAVKATTLWENWQSTSFAPAGRYVTLPYKVFAQTLALHCMHG